MEKGRHKLAHRRLASLKLWIVTIAFAALIVMVAVAYFTPVNKTMSPKDIGEQIRKEEESLLKEDNMQINNKYANDGPIFPNNRQSSREESNAAAVSAAGTTEGGDTTPAATTLPDTTEADTTEGTSTLPEPTTLPDTTEANSTEDTGTPSEATTLPDTTEANTTEDTGTPPQATTLPDTTAANTTEDTSTPPQATTLPDTTEANVNSTEDTGTPPQATTLPNITEANSTEDTGTPPEATTLPDTTEANSTEDMGTPSEATTLSDTTEANSTDDTGTPSEATTVPDTTEANSTDDTGTPSEATTLSDTTEANSTDDTGTPSETTTLPDTTEANSTEDTVTPPETATLPDTTGADTTHDAGTTLAATTLPGSTRASTTEVAHTSQAATTSLSHNVTTTASITTVITTTLAATTRDPNIIGDLPEDTPLELEEIDHVYEFAVQIDQEYSDELADKDSNLYKEASSNFTEEMTPYYNATAGFKEIRNIVFSPFNEASVVRSAAILAVENPTKVDYEVVYEYTAMDNKELTCEELKTDSDPPLTYVGDCGDPEVVKVCDYAVDSCESGFQQVEVDYQCVCQSKCKQGYCENDGKCEHTDEIKCWCSSDSNYFYVGDRCQSKLNKTAMIAVISVSAALFLIIIIILVVCLAKSRRRKDTTKYTDQPNNRQSRSYPDGSHYYNPQIPSYDNQGFLQTLDHEIDSSNPDEMNDTIAMETFQGHNGHMSGVPEHTANPRGNNYERYEPMSDDMDVYPHPWTSAANNDTHEPMTQPTNVNRWSSYAANPAAGNRLSFNLDNIDPYKDVKIRRAKFNPDRLSKNLTVDVEANI